MKAANVLDRQIVIEVVCAMILLAVILVGGYVLYSNVNGSGLFSKGDLLIDFQDNDVPSNLYAMSDGVGLSTSPYIYTVTNNNKKATTIVITLDYGMNKTIEPYLRIALDEMTIKSLEEFDKTENGAFILYKEDLNPGVTSTHSIKIWLSNKSPNGLSGTKANFHFNLKEE